MSRAAHRFKDWVILQKLDRPVQDFAAQPAEWIPVWNGRVNIIPTSARETVRGVRIEEGITHAIDMRWNPDFELDAEHRFLVDDESLPDDEKRVLHVNSVIDVQEKRRFWLVKCQETR